VYKLWFCLLPNCMRVWHERNIWEPPLLTGWKERKKRKEKFPQVPWKIFTFYRPDNWCTTRLHFILSCSSTLHFWIVCWDLPLVLYAIGVG
jgi:hypothetical protein